MTTHSIITNICAREILDSRGNPTVEVEVFLNNNAWARAAAPSGASTGSKEACELRDGDVKRFHGRGVLCAVSNVNDVIAPKLIGLNCANQNNIDSILVELDGTPNKSKLGANAIVATSMAVLKAAALCHEQPLFEYLNPKATQLPMPLINVLNGGAHANNGLDIQEFMIAPIAGGNFFDAVRMSSEVFFVLKSLLSAKGLSTSVGDEGGVAPALKNHHEALELLMMSIEKAGYTPGEDFALALDVAASEFYKAGQYNFEGKIYSADELVAWFEHTVAKFPIFSLEDPLAEDDYEGWRLITSKLGHKIQIVGDDIFVTNKQILASGIKEKMANAILIKPNQVGTVTETFETIKLAQQNGYRCIMSHRSGETEDTTIAHLAVGYGCEQIKTGSVCRSDRTAKYNELIRIEERLGDATALWSKTACGVWSVKCD